MKKMCLYIVSALFFLNGCDNSCDQPFDQNDKPEISVESYNTCNTILGNYFYMFHDVREFPYNDKIGDTLKVCGWVKNEGNPTPNHLWISDDPLDTSINHTTSQYHILLTGLDSLPSDFNISKKCYVTGTLWFTDFGVFHGGEGRIPHDFCTYRNVALIIQDIRFE